jgi:hypothetical protein
VFEPYSNARGQTVKERCDNLDKSALMTQGWRPDKNVLGGTGFDSDGNYVETYFTKVEGAQMSGHRIRWSSPEKQTREDWQMTRKHNNEYHIAVDINGEKTLITVSRQRNNVPNR